MLELNTHCILFALNTVIKSDPLLTKMMTCLKKGGQAFQTARICMSAHWKCDRHKYQTIPTKQRLKHSLLPLFSLNSITAKILNPPLGEGDPYKLHLM